MTPVSREPAHPSRTGHRRPRGAVLACGLAAAALALGGCTGVRGRRGEPELSGFLGNYSQLKKDPHREAELIYIRPGVDWSRYSAVQLDSVTLWGEAATKLDPEEAQKLANYFYTALYQELSKQFRMVDRPGPGVLRIRAALTQAKGAKVVARTVGTLIPQAYLLGAMVGLAADTAVTVGTATAEMEAQDSLTGQRLAAAVDQRAGNKGLVNTNTFKTWGDVDAACHFWARRVASFLAEQGVQGKP